MSLYYADTSAVIKLLVEESHSKVLAAFYDAHADAEWVSSALLRIELTRAVTRAMPTLLPDARDLLLAFSFVAIDDDIVEEVMNEPIEGCVPGTRSTWPPPAFSAKTWTPSWATTIACSKQRPMLAWPRRPPGTDPRAGWSYCGNGVAWSPWAAVLNSIRSSLPLPKPAVLDPVAAGGHVAPGTCPAVGAVIEGPPAVRITAGLEPLPGAIALSIADQQEQREQGRAGPVGGAGAEANLPARADL